MPPRKKKQKDDDDKEFEKAEKKHEQRSKWLDAIDNNNEEEPEIEIRKPTFDFSKQQQYLKHEDERLKRKEELLKMLYEAEEEQQPEEELSDHETQQEKAARIRKQEQVKERKRMKKQRERELRKLENELEEEEQKKKKAIQEIAQDKPKKQGINWLTIVAVFLSFLLLYFFYYVQMRQRLESFKVSDEDLYAVLEADTAMTDSQLKSQYRRLVLKYHPDTNKECRDCKEKFDKIMKAWEVIGNPKKRQEYDQSYGHITHIKSSSVTLTEKNYHLLVQGSDELWIIEVYDESDKYSHHFADLWEAIVQEYSDFVKFGRVDAWHQQDMLDYIPYSFKLFPSIYSLRKGVSNIYSFNFNDLMTSLKRFVDEQLVDNIEEVKQKQSIDIAELMKDGRVLLVLPTEKKYMPYQMRAISLKLEKLMKTVKINPKMNRKLVEQMNLREVRLYLKPQKYLSFEIPHVNDDFLELQRKIINNLEQEMSVCQLMEQCQNTTCMIMLNRTQEVESHKHMRVIIRQQEFYEKLEKFKEQTNQREKFDVAIYMDGKIVLGYHDQVDDMTLEEGDLFELECKLPLRIKWKKVICGIILISLGLMIKNKTWRLIFGVSAVYFLGELLRFVQYFWLT